MNTNQLFASAALAAALAASGGAHATNLIANGGFEGGTYSVGDDSDIPVDWTPNTAVTTFPGFDYDRPAGGAFAHSGQFGLEIGTLSGDPIPTFSQSFADTIGTTYIGSFYALARDVIQDPTASLYVSIDGATKVTVADVFAPYTQETFSFVGTGSDTITFGAQNSPNFFIDDVSVSPSRPAVPEPAAWTLMLAGFGLLGGVTRRRRSAALVPIEV